MGRARYVLIAGEHVDLLRPGMGSWLTVLAAVARIWSATATTSRI